jgi:O-antigen/teichoic acid export membrane protein
MILSRLISPEETGVYSIGVAIAALTHAVRDFGVGNFLIKEAELTQSKTNTAFTVSMMIAVVLSIVLMAVAVPVANFYSQPEVAVIIWITTAGLFISPFSTVNLALMLRKQKFRDMFKVSMASAIVNAVTSIVLAWLGMGAKSLALGALASAATLVIVSNILCTERNIYRFSLSCWHQISRFGMHMTIFGITEQLGGRAGELIVGKLAGFAAVGLLSRSSTLIGMVQDSIQSSVMPVILTNMAAEARSGDVKPLLLKSMQYLTVVMWPIFAVLSMCTHDAIFVLFSQKWLPAAPYMTILCLGAGFATLNSLTSTIFNVTNRADLLSRFSTINQALRVLLIGLGAFFDGLHGVVIMLVVGEICQCVLAYTFVRRATPVTLHEVISNCWRSLAVTVLVAALVWPTTSYLSFAPLWRLLSVILVAAFAWVSMVLLVRHPIAVEIKILKTLLISRTWAK